MEAQACMCCSNECRGGRGSRVLAKLALGGETEAACLCGGRLRLLDLAAFRGRTASFYSVFQERTRGIHGQGKPISLASLAINQCVATVSTT